jgi:hypothetical protein
MVDQDGYTVSDIPITYTIAPADYQAATAYVAIMKKDESGKSESLIYIPAETKGLGTATLSRGFWFDPDPEATFTYEAQVILNYGTGVEIKSAEIPLKVVLFKIIKPAKDDKILITNDTSGKPQMPPLTAEVILLGKDIPSDVLTNLEVSWKVKVEYIVNLPSKRRSRRGLDCDAQGVCKGTDGFLIPSKDWTTGNGLTYTINWGENFGGGILEITAKTTIDGIEVIDTYEGAIQGQTRVEDTSFKDTVTNYLQAPTGAQHYQSIKDAVKQPLFFRIIAYKEAGAEIYEGSTTKTLKYSHFERLSDGPWKKLGEVLGYSSDYVYPIVNKMKEKTSGNLTSDGGFGLMQLTMWGSGGTLLPQYKQIWHWKENIHAAIDEVLWSKLAMAEDWGNMVKNGCPTCEPPIPEALPDDAVVDPLSKGRELKMDLYSLYQSNRHYWKWNAKRQRWYPWKDDEEFTKGKKLPSGTVYADDAESKEKTPPTGF